MLKRVQHDLIHNTLCPRLPDGFPLNVNRSPSVILNLFQDLSAEKNKKDSRWDLETSSAWLNETKQASVILTIPYVIKDVLDERKRITCLTLFNLLTLGIAQASLALLSLNRKFQDLSAEKNKKDSRWDLETSSAWLNETKQASVILNLVQDLSAEKDKKDSRWDAELNYSPSLIENIF